MRNGAATSACLPSTYQWSNLNVRDNRNNNNNININYYYYYNNLINCMSELRENKQHHDVIFLYTGPCTLRQRFSPPTLVHLPMEEFGEYSFCDVSSTLLYARLPIRRAKCSWWGVFLCKWAKKRRPDWLASSDTKQYNLLICLCLWFW